MHHLLLFESYIDRLDEISFSDHWIERTSLKDPLSRTVPYTNNSFGFRITGFLDDNGNNLSFLKGTSILGVDGVTLDNYLSKALYTLTNNKKLQDWKPSNDKEIQMLDLGRICFYKDGINLYPVFKAAKGPDKPGFYGEGDNIWGLVRKNTEGVTILYYTSNEEGIEKMYSACYHDIRKKVKISKFDFARNSAYGYPYEKDFKLIVDLTDNKELSILNKLKAQFGNEKWELGPTKEKEIQKSETNYDDREFKRLQLSNGLTIGIINQETGKTSIYEVYGDPINTNDMLANYFRDKEEKTNLLKQTPVVFKAYPMTELKKYSGPNVTSSYSKASSITKTVTLNPEDQVYIKKAKGSPLDPNQIYRFKFVTSEPKILQKGSAQIALDIV